MEPVGIEPTHAS